VSSSLGFRIGNWLTADECRAVLSRAFGTSLRAKRDYAMLAVLFGCGLRRSELVGLDVNDLQLRQDHWAIVDLIGKGGHIRTVPIPTWAKTALDQWTAAAKISKGKIFRAVARGKTWGEGISQNVVWYVVKECCERAGLLHIAPHDLRRTCARLCDIKGGEIEQIQFLLGHASVQTTERYLGCKQNLGQPVNDLFQLGNIAFALQASFWSDPETFMVKTRGGQADKISIHEGSSDQERSGERAGNGLPTNGHAAV
jgi:integrase